MKQPARSRFFPEDKRKLWRPAHDSWEFVPFNLIAHGLSHPPVLWAYTSKATLDTVISTPWYPPRDFSIISVKANVTGTPVSTDLVWDVLIGGNSIFASTAERPHIKAGDLDGRKAYPSRQSLPEGSKLQAQGVTLSAATGPLVLTFELEPI